MFKKEKGLHLIVTIRLPLIRELASMKKMVVIGCSASEIIASCQVTISSLAKEGHKIYAIIATSHSSESSSLSSSPEITTDQKLLAEIGIAQTFHIQTFDYSAITQANADAVNVHIKDIRPSLVIMPSWKSPNYRRRILARVSLIACRGIGTILMYELDTTNNTDFVPSVIFEVSSKPSKTTGSEVIKEKFESHRTLLLEEDGLF
jgi:hypothetical protein